MEKIEYYELRMSTSNPSADKSGYFWTEEEALECQKELEKVVKKDNKRNKENRYYGKTDFSIEKITQHFGKEYFG